MGEVILASEECDVANEVICAPTDVKELFEFDEAIFTVFGVGVTKTIFLMFLAAFVVVALLYFGLRKRQLVPSKFGSAIEALLEFVRDGIAKDVIGPEGYKYVPYLTAIFFFILIGNLFEVTPFINFPITSRMAIPAFLAIVTYAIFMFMGFAKNGFRFLIDTIWPMHVPIGLRWLVGLIELVSVFLLRPFTLAVRLFANMVAGHLMLTLLLGSGVIFLTAVGDIGIRALIGIPWFVLGVAIFVFEVVVSVLQAYIFTLLSAVYIQSSIQFEH